MARYINWADLIGRYPSLDTIGGASEIGSSWIGYIENQVDGLLAENYTVPFSNNNVTVKDLCIELVYARIGTLKIKESASIKKDIMDRVKRLNDGTEKMLDSSGTTIEMVADAIWSETGDYAPTFDKGNILYQEVDPNQIKDIDDGKL